MRTDDMPVIELNGSSRERGRIHGEMMRHQIRDLLAARREFLAEQFQEVDEFTQGFENYADFEPAIRSVAGELLEEVRGIADGAGIDYRAAFHLQLMDEEWAYGFYHQSLSVLLRKCTAFAVRSGSGTIAGQNMDLPKYFDGRQVLLRIKHQDSDLTSNVFSYAGGIGLVGINNVPLGICCNTLTQLRASGSGIPVAFIVRKVLECNSFDAAVTLVKSTKHASGQNYIISTPGRIGSFECSAGKVVEYVAEKAGDRIVHTNHPLANDDQQDFEELMRQIPQDQRPTDENSRQRFQSIHCRLVADDAGVNLDGIKAALGAHDDPENPVSWNFPEGKELSDWFTAGSVIFEHSKPARLHLAAGPPCSTEFSSFAI